MQFSTLSLLTWAEMFSCFLPFWSSLIWSYVEGVLIYIFALNPDRTDTFAFWYLPCHAWWCVLMYGLHRNKQLDTLTFNLHFWTWKKSGKLKQILLCRCRGISYKTLPSLKCASGRQVVNSATVHWTTKLLYNLLLSNLALEADLNWARRAWEGQLKRDGKYSSQMERWRGQRAGVSEEEGGCSPVSFKTSWLHSFLSSLFLQMH